MSCTFCDFTKIESRTIATIDGFHITISLGQITDGGYLLIIPTKHTPCLGAMSKSQINHFEFVLDEVFDHLYLEYDNSVTFFEHGIVGQTVSHAHLHIFPARVSLKSQIETDFPNSPIESVKSIVEFRILYQKKKTPYLLWSTPEDEIEVCWNPPAKSEYLRLLTANLLSVPERGSWKNMDRTLDEKLTEETIAKLGSAFIP